MPRVTVLIPTYNRSELLPCSIGSVLRQTFTDFELLVVGDGCTDDSERVVSGIGDARVRWIGLPGNSGHQSAPNNEGLRQARGEIIAYLGHDDLWLPGHLQAHLEALDSTASDLAASICMIVAPDGTSWPQILSVRRKRFSPPSAVTHRRALTKEIGAWRDYRSVGGAPDVELWERACAARKTFALVRRLTAIRFPASLRRDSYVTRSSDEQERWLAQIDADPQLENELLVKWIVDDRVPTGIAYGELARHFLRQTVWRIRRRLATPSFASRKPRPGDIDRARRYKGL